MLLAFCGRAHCWLHLNFLFTCTLDCSLWWFFQLVVLQCVLVYGVSLLQVQVFPFPFCCPSQVSFSSSTPACLCYFQAVYRLSASVILSSFVASANMLRVQCVPSSRSWMKFWTVLVPLLTPGVYHLWLFSKWTLCPWPQLFELGTFGSFQSTSPSTFVVCALSVCLWGQLLWIAVSEPLLKSR